MFPRPHVLNYDRYEKAIAARDFFMRIYNACCEHICIENPVPFNIRLLFCPVLIILYLYNYLCLIGVNYDYFN